MSQNKKKTRASASRWVRRGRRLRLFLLSIHLDLLLAVPAAMAEGRPSFDPHMNGVGLRLEEVGQTQDFQFGDSCELLTLLDEDALKQLISVGNMRFFQKFCRAGSVDECASLSPLFTRLSGHLTLARRDEDAFCRYVPGDVIDLPPGAIDMEDICIHCG